ncbi:MAG TPA: hypothetical protein VGW38_17195, partial [Chloroflexota bacterium]|nr:hypothetical protein [Chloroflexota bacterium]
MNPTRFDCHQYEAFALPYYGDKDPAHGAAHLRQILSRLDELSQTLEPPPRQDRLYFLACFHGLFKRVATDAAFRAEVERFLASLGWTPEETADALAALARHATDPQTPEECVVHDANACERLGAFGIAKA